MSGPRRRLAAALLAAAGLLGAAGVSACSVSASVSASASASGAAPAATTQHAASPANLSCAWPSTVGVQTANRIVPDSAAAYWVQPIVATGNAVYRLSGRFPDARYFSLSVYTPQEGTFTSHGAGSSLPDYRIAANQGSVNPWQSRGTAGGAYTVTIQAGAGAGQRNVLPMPPGTSPAHPGYLVYRVYLPAATSLPAIPLPSISISHGSTTERLGQCPSRTAGVWPPASSPASAASPATAPPTRVFFEPSLTKLGALVTNADASYLEAYFATPPAGDVVVITARAPTTPSGSHPSVWPDLADNMRYWSMCVAAGVAKIPTVANRLPGGKTDYGCRDDDSTAVDAAGNYSYVLGSESQRAAISAVRDATFLPFQTGSTARFYVVLLRNLLVSSGFSHSPLAITKTGDPAAATAAMGPYYPQIRTCPLATVVKDGMSAC